MALYLIRHTTPDVAKGICYGQTDLDVHADFLAEAAVVKTHLPARSAKALVYSSPLQRCYKLAKYLFPEADIQVDDRLKELNFGAWEMVAWEAIEKETFAAWRKNFVHAVVPEGESYWQLAQRVKNFHADLLKVGEEQDIFIVAHAGVMHAYLAMLEGRDLKDTFGKRKIEYGEVFLRPLRCER